jgi:membrane protein DedA with SNARE-associated domain
MRRVLATLTILALGESQIQDWMQHAFYPVLLGILVIASLGIPIPEDVPLIAAGVILRFHPGAASFTGTFLVALLGIMTGDLVLYTLGRMWGPGVVNHRSVNWIITTERFEWAKVRFARYGTWMVFGGRFIMGIRAVMCLTAGATHYPYWRFFLADLCGAVLSIPLFVVLGYWFGGVITPLMGYVRGVGWIAAAVVLVAITAFVIYEYRKHRRKVSLLGLPPVRAHRSGADAEAAAAPQRPGSPPGTAHTSKPAPVEAKTELAS